MPCQPIQLPYDSVERGTKIGVLKDDGYWGSILTPKLFVDLYAKFSDIQIFIQKTPCTF